MRTGIQRCDRFSLTPAADAARALWRPRAHRALARLSRNVPPTLSLGDGAANVGPIRTWKGLAARAALLGFEFATDT